MAKSSYAGLVTVIYSSIYAVVVLVTSIICAIDVHTTRKSVHAPQTKANESIQNTEKADAKEEESLTMSTIKFKITTKSNLKSKKAANKIYHKNVFIHWGKMVWSKKKIYWAMIPHIFDQATDFGVIVEYFHLYKQNDRIGSTNPFWFFWLSIIIIVVHRIVSSITVYAMSRNRNDFLLQIFDVLIMKAIWVSYKLKTTEPSNMQRYLGLLEATFESAPQIMLTMVFMLKSAETNTKISAVFILSTLFSLWSLSSRVISDDSIMFK
eukprot:364105_1